MQETNTTSIKMRYGKRFPSVISDVAIELFMWREWTRLKEPELERWEHLRNAALIIVPNLQKTYNAWFERCVKAYSDYSYIAGLGCMTSGKTYSFHTLAYLDFMSDPENTQVICTTTSVEGIKKRQWPIFTALFNSPFRPAGWVKKIAPQMVIQSSKDDTKHAIRMTPVQQKADESEMVDNLVGAHSKRVVMLVDEATSAPGAVLTAWANLAGGTDHRRLVMLGNPDDELDTLGTFCRPEGGWNSVDVETDEWGFTHLSEKGIGLHFDGLKSPNLDFPRNADGSSRFNFLFGHMNAEQHSNKESYEHWRYCRGWFTDNTIVPKVVTMTEIDQNHCRDGVIFQGETERFASLDPAFGGDRPILKIFTKGVDADTGKMMMRQDATFEIQIPANSIIGKVIGEFAMEKSREFGFKTVGIDTTTDNSAPAEYLKLNSDLDVIDVPFGGAPTGDPVSPTDKTPCREKYDRFVTELWFNIKQALPQLRGLDADTCSELCARYFDRIGRPEKLCIEKKQEMKRRIKGKSPDKADSLAVGVFVFKKLGGFESPEKGGENDRWVKLARKKNSIYSSEFSYKD